MLSSKRKRDDEESKVKENVYKTLIDEVIIMLNNNEMYIIKQFKEKKDKYDIFTFILCKKNNADYISDSNKYTSPYIISRVTINIREDMVNEGYQTRSSKQVDATIFYIKEVFTHLQERGLGFATLLLIYGMCNVKLEHNEINIFTLEDCSNMGRYMIDNLYAKLGFVFQGFISLNKKKSSKIISDGPEKQLDLNTPIEEQLFKTRAMKRLKEIDIKLERAGIKKHKKTQKNTKKHKKTQKKHKKTQKKHKKTKKH